MKKIIMFVMVLAIATPAMALIWEPHTQGFAGCEGSGQVLWEFTEPGCMPTTALPTMPYFFNPDVEDPVFGTSYTDGGPVVGWTWSDGVYTVDGEDGLNQPIPDRGDKKYMRMYFEVVHTMQETNDPSLLGFALELWDRGDWAGCPVGAQLGGEYNGYYFEPPNETIDLQQNGWHQSYWVYDFSTDGSVGTDTFPILHDATHTTALFGMLDLGDVRPFDLEEVYINYIWYNNADGSDIPTEPAGSIIGLSSVQIDPPQPSSSDVIDITLSGSWSNSCTPISSFVWVAGDEINFEVIPSYSCGCLLAITSWELTDYVGPLSSGTYTINAYLLGDPCNPVSDPYTFVVSDDYYVDAADGNDLNDGRSWATAFATIQKGVDTAENCDKVIVADGTYTGPGNRDIDFLGKAITVSSANGPENCIIDCEEAGLGFYFHNGEDASSVADGFTIVAGKHYDDPCGSPISTYGGGISCRYGSSPTIRNCTISDSYASFGGGIYCGGSSPTIMNCLIYNNSGVNGAGIWVSSNTNTKILNCTIVDNSGHNSGGVAGSSGQVINSILWGNTPNQAGSNSTVRYSDVQGGWPGEGNIVADPLFVDPNNGDYHLKSRTGRWDPNTESWVLDDVTSPCIDAGNPGCPLGDEPSEPNNVRINMGAYGGTAEASKTPVGWGLLGDLTNDGLIDNEDFTRQAMDWQQTESCQPGDLNRDGTVNLPDVVLTAADWLKTTTWH